MMQGGGGGEITIHAGGGGGDGRRSNDDPNRDGIKQQPNKQVAHPHPQQPQKCPRCESLNTKFCYYNNYSLTQPRYFCKNCRRYWTQGGTLRNVPVGGGCRKGKRPKITAAGSSSGGATSASTVTASTNAANTLTNTTMNPPPGLPPFGFGSYNFGTGGTGGGFLSSLAAVQSFAHPGAVGINMGSADLGARGGGGPSSFSNLGLLMHGNFNSNMNHPPPTILPPNFGSHQHQPITRQFYQTNSTDPHQQITSSSTDHQLGPGPGPGQQQQQHPQLINWPLHHQGLMLVPDTSLWSISTTATANTATTGAANVTDNVVVGSSGHQWNNDHRDHLPGYGPPQ